MSHRATTLPRPCPPRRAFAARRGMTLIEVMISLGIFGLVLAALTSQFIESVSLSLKTARTLEYVRNSRWVIDRLSADTRTAQTVALYPSFADRSSQKSDGETGNYLVLHEINASGTITRTVGYYVVATSSSSWTLHRHDSADGVLNPGTLPEAISSGSHRVVIPTLRLPGGANLFTNFRDRGFSLRGEFGAGDGAAPKRLDTIQCTLTTRS